VSTGSPRTPPTEPTRPPRAIAAFDFDGTITRRDTLGPFLVHVAGRRRVTAAMGRRLPAMAGSLRNDALRDVTKERILGDVLAGRTHDELIAAGERYATTLIDRFRPEALERIDWHRSQAHELVVVSASLVYYLRPVARRLGFDDVIGVEMETRDGRLTGALAGPNVRADEKPRRLRSWIGDGGAEIWAYGNSSGDEALLAAADHAVWMGKRADRNP